MKRLTEKAKKAEQMKAMTRLSAVLEKRALSYAAAAGAAGVSMMALSRSAEAKIIYTPANIPIQSNQVLPVDLNHDGVKDFFFFLSMVSSQIPTTLSIDPARPNNRILGNKLYASALESGVNVGPGGNFQREHDFMVENGTVYPGPFASRGPWKGTTDRYLGLQFFINGEAHYGWARVTVSATKYPMTATLTGYAYESEPNTAIMTGATSGDDERVSNLQPDSVSSRTQAQASLGLLSSGAAGLEAWRGR